MNSVVEVAGEDYAGNKVKDKLDALNEAIDGAVNDLRITVQNMIWEYHGSPDVSKNNGRWTEIRKEAVERIKKFL